MTLIKEFLQGSWLKHPLHPALAHIPMALWPAALLFDVLARAGVGGNDMVRTAFYAIGLGVAAALLALPTGLADWWDIKRERPAHTLGLYHMGLNLLAMLVWVINFFWRIPTVDEPTVALTPFVLSIVGTLLLFVAAYLGGRMVFAHGTSVARHSRDKWREIAEAGGARLPERDDDGDDDGESGDSDDEESDNDD